MKKILVPFDGSDLAVQAAQQAADIAKAFNCEITFLTVVVDKTMLQYSVVGGDMSPGYLKMLTATLETEKLQAGERLENLLQSIGADKLKSLSMVATGDITAKILEIAEDGQYDLVVMGHRGLNPIKRLMIGSIAKNIVEHAHCSVMIVKKRA